MRLVRGAPGSGKTALVFREFREALASGQAARIVVPTATLVRHYQHELARDGAVFPPSSVLSLGRLSAARTNQLPLRTAIRRELKSNRYPAFAPVAETAGLIDTITETIELFENAGATPSKLMGVKKIGPHGQAFFALWRAVEQHTTRVADVRQLAANPLAGRIWMDGFLTFSPLEWELVSALSRSSDLTLTLPDSPVFNDVRRMAMALGARDEPIYGTGRRPERVVLSATSIEREADEIARRILELRERGTGFGEIGIALRDAETYLPLLRTTLERFNIPARFYFSDSLANHPAAKFLNGVVENTPGGWEFGAAIRTLRAHPAWGRQAWLDRLDFKVRETMPARGADALLEQCEEDHRRQLSECLSAAHWAHETVRVKDWVHRLSHMARSLYRPGRIEVALNARDVAAARDYAGGLREWVSAIESAAECWSDTDENVPLEQFWEVAREAVETAALPVRDGRAGVVHVMNVFEARQWDVAALFVCGLTHRDFPKRPVPHLLFSESDLDRIVRAGIAVRRAQDSDRQEEALMTSLEGRASSVLFLSYPTHDSHGRSIERSSFADNAIAARNCRVAPLVSAPSRGVAGAIMNAELLQIRELSATSLETLTQCRFRFFAGKSLGLRSAPESPRQRIGPRNMGMIVHRAMERWTGAGRAEPLVEVFDREFAKGCVEYRLPPGYALEVERLRWRGFAQKLNGKDNWRVESSEQEITLTATLPGGVKVTCRVDRLDVLPNGQCVILDYKSGAIANIRDNTEDETRLQGPLYALAARQDRGLETVAMMYLALQTERFFGWGQVPGMRIELERLPANWIETAVTRAQERLTDFLAGNVHAAPTHESHCRFCDAKHACRVEQREALVMVEGAHG